MKITAEGWAIVERDSHLGRWVEEHKRLDFDQNALPQMLPYIKPGSIVLDIGANIGCYAYAFAKIAKEVHCIEPNIEAFTCLKHNMKSVSNVWVNNIAFSDRIMSYETICENNNIGMAYISENKCSPNKTCTIDYLANKYDFIKIDVEGYELHILKGGEHIINTYKPVIVIEINDHTLKRTGVDRKEIFAWLTDHGYMYRNIYAEQGLQDDQLDIICFPS
jgi:FkbM family methyltransferase